MKLKRLLRLLLCLGLLIGILPLNSVYAATQEGGASGTGSEANNPGTSNWKPGSGSDPTAWFWWGGGFIFGIETISNTTTSYSEADQKAMSDRASGNWITQGAASLVDTYYYSTPELFLNNNRAQELFCVFTDKSTGGDGYSTGVYCDDIDAVSTLRFANYQSVAGKKATTSYNYGIVYDTLMAAKNSCTTPEKKKDECTCLWHTFCHGKLTWDALKDKIGESKLNDSLSKSKDNFCRLWINPTNANSELNSKVLTDISQTEDMDAIYESLAKYLDFLVLVSYCVKDDKLDKIEGVTALSTFLANLNMDGSDEFVTVVAAPVVSLQNQTEKSRVLWTMPALYSAVYNVSTNKLKTPIKPTGNAWQIHNSSPSETTAAHRSALYVAYGKAVRGSSYKLSESSKPWKYFNKVNAVVATSSYSQQMLYWMDTEKTMSSYLFWSKDETKINTTHYKWGVLLAPTDTKNRALGNTGYGYWMQSAAYTEDDNPMFNVTAEKVEDEEIVEVPEGGFVNRDVNITHEMSNETVAQIIDAKFTQMTSSEANSTNNSLVITVKRKVDEGTDQNQEDKVSEASYIAPVDKVYKNAQGAAAEQEVTENIKIDNSTKDTTVITITGLSRGDVLKLLKTEDRYLLKDLEAIIEEKTKITYTVSTTLTLADGSKYECVVSDNTSSTEKSVSVEWDVTLVESLTPEALFSVTGKAANVSATNYGAEITVSLTQKNNMKSTTAAIVEYLQLGNAGTCKVVYNISVQPVKGTLDEGTVCVDSCTLEGVSATPTITAEQSTATITVEGVTPAEVGLLLDGGAALVFNDTEIVVKDPKSYNYLVSVQITSQEGIAVVFVAEEFCRWETDETIGYANVLWDPTAAADVGLSFYLEADNTGYTIDNPGADLTITISSEDSDTLLGLVKEAGSASLEFLLMK